MSLTTAIDELTKPWSEILAPDEDREKHVIVRHEPRIVMLRGMIGSNSGGTTAGGSLPSTRNLVNVPALDLWQKIDEQTRSALESHGKRPAKELADALDQLGTDADTLRATNNMTEADHTRLITRAQRWKSEIENLYDPPTRKEIRGACPECHEARVTTAGGETSAISAYYWKGKDPAAECQVCGTVWTGQAALIELGEKLEAGIDYAALHTIGAR